MRVAISGASGLIGTALSEHLFARGDDVLHLVRRPARTSAEISWDPAEHELDPDDLVGVDAVVHLAGVGIGDKRWTPSYKHEIFASRVDGTHTVASALATAVERSGSGTPRPVLVSASGVDIYGADRGEEELTEESSLGTWFLSDVARAWESAAKPAADAGVRVAFARSSPVLSREGGAMGKMLPLARLGLGGPLGDGRQWFPWTTLHDQVRVLAFLLDTAGISGPVNVASPRPTRQKELADALGRALHRPSVVPAPAFGIRLALGEFAEAVLGSKKVVPAVLQANGFAWDHPDVDSAVAWVTGTD